MRSVAWLKLLAALVACAMAAALGWWLRLPQEAHATANPMTDAPPLPRANDPQNLPTQQMAQSLSALDPFGLQRNAPAGASAVPAKSPAADPVATATWTLAATVVHPGERYIVLTADQQPPLIVRQGAKLPGGDKVEQVETDHVVLRSPRGRTRTLYLIQP